MLEREETTASRAQNTPLVNLLQGIPFFASLDRSALEDMGSRARRLTFAPGEMVFFEGDPCAGLFVVERGRCKIFKTSAEGREQTLHVILQGHSLNEVSVSDGGPNPANVIAVDDTILWNISRDDLQALAFRYPAVSWALLEHVARRARTLVSIVEDLGLRPVRARLAKLLLEEAERSTQGELERDYLLTQQEMAARLGTVREMVGRALRTLMDEGAIKIERHRIIIVDQDLLRQEAML